MNKRGQAALEFLMTYGWAILVVMVIIGALAYFGVLNPMMFVPERCTLGTGLNCDQAFLIETDGLTIRVLNSLGRDIRVTDFNATYQGDGVSCTWENAEDETIINGRSFDFVLENCDLELHEGRKIQMDLELRYFPVDAGAGFATTTRGSVLATVQE